MNPEGATGQPGGMGRNLKFMRFEFPMYQFKIFEGGIWENPDRTWITEPYCRR
jgi:hypothetical protein